MEREEERKKLLGFLGLCRRAGQLICGTTSVFSELAKKKKPALVLYAENASDATKKHILSKCAFYGVRALPFPASTGELADVIGKKNGLTAAVGVTDEQMADALCTKIARLPAADTAC